MSDIVDDCVLELRTLARLIETKAQVTFREQDAATLREAAEQIKRLRAALANVVKAWDSPGSINNAVEIARAALKEQ